MMLTDTDLERAQAAGEELGRQHARSLTPKDRIQEQLLREMALRALKEENIAIERIGYQYKPNPAAVVAFSEAYCRERGVRLEQHVERGRRQRVVQPLASRVESLEAPTPDDVAAVDIDVFAENARKELDFAERERKLAAMEVENGFQFNLFAS